MKTAGLPLARWAVSLGLVAAVSCASPSDDAAPRLERLERDVARLDAELGEAQAQLGAQGPLAGLPAKDEEGEPLPIEPGNFKGDPVEDADPDCPEMIRTYIRAEQGSTCADYEAEISVFLAHCVAACDADAIARRTIRIAMNVCSQWCSEKRCGTTSFIPPPAGCRAGNCFPSADDCPSQRCPLREYCSLISTDRVWNCFCRDIVPT